MIRIVLIVWFLFNAVLLLDFILKRFGINILTQILFFPTHLLFSLTNLILLLLFSTIIVTDSESANVEYIITFAWKAKKLSILYEKRNCIVEIRHGFLNYDEE